MNSWPSVLPQSAPRSTKTASSYGEWKERVTGAPVLADALAALDCRVTDIIPLDTHAILIGVVEDVLFGPRRRRSSISRPDLRPCWLLDRKACHERSRNQP